MKNLGLCQPTREAVELIASLGVCVVEIGARDGLWMRAIQDSGTEIIAYDNDQCGDGVTFGDHHKAARDGAAMLAVWPPDGDALQEWINAAKWAYVALCGEPDRMVIGDALSRFRIINIIALPDGKKGSSTLTIYQSWQH